MQAPPSPTPSRQPSLRRPAAQPSLLKSQPAQASAPAAAGTQVNGQAGSPRARPVYPPHQADGEVKAHGEIPAIGEVTVDLAVHGAQAVQVVLAASAVLGAQKLAASTATTGQPGLLAGAHSLRGQELGLAAALPPAHPFLRLSLQLSRAADQRKSLLAQLSVSRLLPLPPPVPIQATQLLLSAVSAPAVLLLLPFSLPCLPCRRGLSLSCLYERVRRVGAFSGYCIKDTPTPLDMGVL